MLVPRNRLLLWVALIALPFAVAGATIPGAVFVAAIFIGGLFAAAIVDAALARAQLAGIRVELPELVRLQKDRTGSFELRIHNETQAARVVRIGFAFPPEIASESDDRLAQLPADATVSRLSWQVTPNRRGQYFLSAVYLEAASPLGFWAIRKTQPSRAELRVYPDLRRERRSVAALFLKRGQLGAHAQRQAGQGRDFEKLREYIAGDSYDEIHWKASAKRGHPVTKVFQVERTQEVYVIVDASRLSAREVPSVKCRESSGGGPSPPDTRPPTLDTSLERFVSAALILGLAAERQGDQFGLLTFSDRVLSFVRAKSGQAHFDACRDQLYGLEAQSVSPDFEELCSFIRLRLRKRALLIFLTALDDPVLAESFTKATELISRQHLIFVNMLEPAGARPLFRDRDPARVDDLYARLGGHLRWASLHELERVLRKRGIRFSLLDPDKLAAQLVEQHADAKRRQLI